MWAPELLPLARALLPGLQLADAEYVLEVGAGVGAFLPEIYRAAPRATVLGVDLAEGMIALAPRDFPIAAMDATRLAFRDATFDAGILAFVLFHVPRPLDALQEMRRVLRSGATVATVTWGQDPGYRALEIWIEELEAHGAAPAESLARHELVDTPEKVTSLLGAAGFSSPHAWIGFYDRQMTPEEFLAHRTGHGSSRCRF
jgi:SAM-dependent methyltransferase